MSDNKQTTEARIVISRMRVHRGVAPIPGDWLWAATNENTGMVGYGDTEDEARAELMRETAND